MSPRPLVAVLSSSTQACSAPGLLGSDLHLPRGAFLKLHCRAGDLSLPNHKATTSNLVELPEARCLPWVHSAPSWA